MTPLIDGEEAKIILPREDLGFARAAQCLADAYQGWKDQCIKISSNNERFDYMIRSVDSTPWFIISLADYIRWTGDREFCLFTGILPGEQARQVIKRLLLPDFFSGWGICTMSNREVAYNPMSYHNGSVWPHDNAIIGFGMKLAGAVAPLQQLVETLFEAAEYFDHMRLPELFCGFTRRGNAGPVKYPIACDPQAWSISSMFLMLRALLGIECRGTHIYVQNPQLPGFLQTLRLENIRAGNGAAALEFTRRHDKTYCGVIGTKGDVMVIFK
ncbi:MAG: amylo-alpha-1,6-glucosidase [Bacillota bacterium]